MVSHENQVVYACISRGTTVLADFSSGDNDIEALALQCLEKTPPLHLLYSEAVKDRIYCFSIDNPFVYFAIVDEGFGKSVAFQFLDHVKSSFLSFLKNKPAESIDCFSSHCFQVEFGPVFCSLMQHSGEDDQSCSEHTIIEKNAVNEHDTKTIAGLTVEETEILNFPVDNQLDLASDANVIRNRSLPLTPQKIGFSGGHDVVQRRAWRIWRQLLCILLIIDVLVCCVLFGVWLTICGGFHCLDI